MHADGGVRVQRVPVGCPNLAHRLQRLRVAHGAGDEGVLDGVQQRRRQRDGSVRLERRHECGDRRRVSARAEVEEPLDVVRELDVHRRRDRLLVCAHRHVAPRDGPMHDIVGIRRADDSADRAAEPLGEQPARGVAKGAGRDDKVDGPVGSGRDLLARPQVVARLHEHARPVDRVDRADGVAPHEGRVFEDALERLGLLVGVALRAVDEDVRAVHGHHLQLLHARHAPLRIQAEDAHLISGDLG